MEFVAPEPLVDDLEVDDRLRFSIGSAFLEEFVADHDFADMLRELAQNEYDARGSRLEASFGPAECVITGNGKVIDGPGWRRLSVMFSTGRVAGGEGGEIEAKANGIGSKNAGLRTLFLVGNRLIVRSGGKRTVLDFELGSLPEPDRDPASAGVSGVRINVPYRSVATSLLEPFSKSVEERAFDAIEEELGAVVLKLAMPSRGKSLSHVVVSSARLRRRASWTQSVRGFRCRAPGVAGLTRSIRRYRSEGDGEASRTELREWEFLTTTIPPGKLMPPNVPGYFRDRGGAIRISVSVKARGRGADLTTPGTFYYPIGVRGVSTDTGISVCAPFLMNTERSALLDNAWNHWLEREAAELVLSLMEHDWVERFGPESFQLILGQSSSPTTTFGATLLQGLPKSKCWPTARRERGRSVLAMVDDVVIPIDHELAGFLGDEQRLDPRFGDDEIQQWAVGFGAKRFSVNSLVRLRCAPTTSSGLRTALGDTEADLHYPKYSEAFEGDSGLGLQIRMGAALQSHSRRLSAANREDLRNRPATLAADGSLGAPRDLWLVPKGAGAIGHLLPAGRLHPRLAEYKVIAGLCRKFRPDSWILEVCDSARSGDATDEERVAIYAYLVSVRMRVSSRVVGAVRRSPIIRDHRGDWVTAAQLTARTAPGAVLLEPVLHFAEPAIARDQQLISRLGARVRIADSDVLAFAASHVQTERDSERFEQFLIRRAQVASRRLLRGLRDAPILRSSRGALAPPSQLYLRSVATLEALGPDGPYVVGERTGLYRNLGCSTAPRSEDIVSHLEGLASKGEKPQRPEVLYPALVEALSRERLNPEIHSSRSIVSVGDGYVPPQTILAGRRFPKVLMVLPHVRGPDALVAALIRLGASAQPNDRHWHAFFELVGGRYRPGQRAIETDQRLLREAYRRLARRGVPDGLSPRLPILLAHDQTLHPLSAVTRGTFLENDEPDLGARISQTHSRIVFPDKDDLSQDFFAALKLKRLSDVAGRPRAAIGSPAGPPAFLNEQELLTRIHSSAVWSALAAVARAETAMDAHRQPLSVMRIRAEFRKISQISVVREISRHYSVAGSTFRVAAVAVVVNSTIYITPPRSRDALRNLVALALADALGSSGTRRGRLLDSMSRLLAARTQQDLVDYMRLRGIDWSGTGSLGELNGIDDVDLADAVQSLSESLIDETRRRKTSETRAPKTKRPDKTETGKPLKALPPLSEVSLREVPADPNWKPGTKRGGGGGGGGQWRPRTPEEQERDRAVGRRAEELILQQERKRVRKAGIDPNRVTWTADTDPSADHDILSVDDDGETIWIEVKGTTGRDGRFTWPLGEFTRAAQARSRYILCRVYEADTLTPPVKRFRDPIALLGAAGARAGVAAVAMEVEPAG